MFTHLTKRGARKRQEERAKAVRVALDDEMGRFNAAISGGKGAHLDTAFGPYEVAYVSSDFWYTCYPKGQPHTSTNVRSFAGCNDGTWHTLLRQVGEPRSPLFQH